MVLESNGEKYEVCPNIFKTQVSEIGYQKTQKSVWGINLKIQSEVLFAFPNHWLVQTKEETLLISKLFDFLQLHQSKKSYSNFHYGLDLTFQIHHLWVNQNLCRIGLVCRIDEPFRQFFFKWAYFALLTNN